MLNINRVLINHHEKTNRKVDQEWKKEKWKTLMTNTNFTNDKKKVHQHKWNIFRLDWQL